MKIIKVNCGRECLNCSTLPLSEHEERMVRHTLRNAVHKRDRENAERVLSGEIVRIYCIQRGVVVWVNIG